MTGRIALTSLLVAALLGGCGEAASEDTRAALKEGNRLFRSGQLEPALEAYRAGWEPQRPDAVLAYNLATTAHHLDRLPEAALWYRRALAANPGDRWLTDNLDLVRQQLGSRPVPPPGLAAHLGRRAGGLRTLAAGLAWMALGLALAGRRRWADGLGLAALLLLIAGLAVPRFAPRPAVVLEDCAEAGPRAGEEVWSEPPGEDPTAAVTVFAAGGEGRCPPTAVELVEP